MRWPAAALAVAAAISFGAGYGVSAAGGQIDSRFFDGDAHPAIDYTGRPTDDAIARLSRALQSGTARLDFDAAGSGYLRSLLRALDIPVESQLAVFSKTSLQATLISPRNPRTIFFNDTVAVAWPRRGFIEIAAQDRSQGVAFYMLEQVDSPAPRFQRPPMCLTCHVAYATVNVPGLLLRSVATAQDGRSLSYLANATVDHRTPFAERWAGWFVTGTTGTLAHLGNGTVANPESADAVTPAPTSMASLNTRLDMTGYMSAQSDIAALLVFDHQAHMVNLLTRMAWETRTLLADHAPDAAQTIARNAADLVDYLLFVDEAPLPSPVKGGSGFAEWFSAQGPRDQSGRSLRQLDLRTRTFAFPCSYLIYSEAFDALPREALDVVYARLWQILSGAEPDARYARLSAADRRAILEILRTTKANLPSYFVS